MSSVSKVIFGNDVLIDLTSDTVDKDHLLAGVTAHDKSGEVITGECTFDSDTSDATATAAEILTGKTAYVNKNKLTGAMPNNEGVAGVISEKEEEYSVPQGYHDGSGKVKIAEVEQAKLIPENIRTGITVLGVEGTMSGLEEVQAQEKTVTPALNEQTIVPDEGYNYFSQFTVLAIPYAESENAAGGLTATIG